MTADPRDARDGADASAGRKMTQAARGPAPAELAGYGFQFVASILLFMFAGRWLDSRIGTSPLFLVAGVFLGAAASFYSIYRRLTAAQRARPRADG